MLWPISRRLSVKAAGLVLALVALSVWNVALAEDFPPVTDAERAIASVAGSPDAPAVVLYKTGDLRMPHPSAQPVTSILEVTVRLKILTTENGLDEGTVQIVHSGFTRLHDFEGRTVMADGTVVPLPKDASFVTTTSKARRPSSPPSPSPGLRSGRSLTTASRCTGTAFCFWSRGTSPHGAGGALRDHLPRPRWCGGVGPGPRSGEGRGEVRAAHRHQGLGRTRLGRQPARPPRRALRLLPAATFRPA